jgi:hypothetical protein
MAHQHIESETAEVVAEERVGALKFPAIDDLPASTVGELISQDSIIQLPMDTGRPTVPPIERVPEDPFPRRRGTAGQYHSAIKNIP